MMRPLSGRITLALPLPSLIIRGGDVPYTGCVVASCTDTDTPYAGCNSAALGEGDECTIVDDRCDEGLSCQQQGDGSVAHCDRQNIATQATATSPDGIEPDTGGSGGDAHLAIDGDVDTYWDQTSDVAGPHILQFEFNEPTTIDAYEFMAFGVNDYSPKSWQITCDGTTIDEQVEYSHTESFFEHHAEESSECTIVQRLEWFKIQGIENRERRLAHESSPGRSRAGHTWIWPLGRS